MSCANLSSDNVKKCHVAIFFISNRELLFEFTAGIVNKSVEN